VKKGSREGINPRVWHDTGKRLEGKKLYKSILGHYAVKGDETSLETLTREEMAKGGIHVDKSGS